MVANDNVGWDEDVRGMVRMVPVIGQVVGDGEVRLYRPLAAIFAKPRVRLVGVEPPKAD